MYYVFFLHIIYNFYETILKTVHPHPTLSEAIMEATADALGEAIHI